MKIVTITKNGVKETISNPHKLLRAFFKTIFKSEFKWEYFAVMKPNKERIKWEKMNEWHVYTWRCLQMSCPSQQLCLLFFWYATLQVDSFCCHIHTCKLYIFTCCAYLFINNKWAWMHRKKQQIKWMSGARELEVEWMNRTMNKNKQWK